MADIHQLEDKMRMLKLSGMLGTLDMRLSQAQKDGIGLREFLELLLEDEVQHRANRRLSTRVMRARFEEEKSLEGFDFNFNPKLPARYIRDLATCQFIELKESVILCGPVGVGKTHLAQALGHQACRTGYNVLFIKASRLLSDLGGGRADDTWEKRIARYLKPNLLILDDFAMKEFTKTQAEDLYELIDRRHNSSSMIVTANRATKDWYPLFPNPVIAESALDRLVSRAHVVTLTGKSYRSMLRPDKDLEKEVAAV
ncbi:MAG TPA: IS21-like element helper ATPase IstB [Dehalococcoidales bacterium]|nr:IS21-like element helper ATPase IstB [Dehalococcoidales bacterium]